MTAQLVKDKPPYSIEKAIVILHFNRLCSQLAPLILASINNSRFQLKDLDLDSSLLTDLLRYGIIIVDPCKLGRFRLSPKALQWIDTRVDPDQCSSPILKAIKKEKRKSLRFYSAT